MAESIELKDIEQSASLLKTGKDLIESWKATHARERETRKLALSEVEYRQAFGDVDGLLSSWEDFLEDIDVDLLDTERDLNEVECGVAEVQKEHEALLAVYEELSRIKTTIIGDEKNE